MIASIIRLWLIAPFVICLVSCDRANEQEEKHSQLISGRFLGGDGKRPPLYRIEVPKGWQIAIPPLEQPLDDTMQPLVEYFLRDSTGEIKISIHNFPTESLKQRIPPGAQIARWQKQFSQINSAAISITPQAFSGFVGLRFDGEGRLNNKPTRMLAWIMQLAPEHWHTLDALQLPLDEKRSDIAIKAIGSIEALSANEQQILAFARSIELLNPLPMPL